MRQLNSLVKNDAGASQEHLPCYRPLRQLVGNAGAGQMATTTLLCASSSRAKAPGWFKIGDPTAVEDCSEEIEEVKIGAFREGEPWVLC